MCFSLATHITGWVASCAAALRQQTVSKHSLGGDWRHKCSQRLVTLPTEAGVDLDTLDSATAVMGDVATGATQQHEHTAERRAGALCFQL